MTYFRERWLEILGVTMVLGSSLGRRSGMSTRALEIWGYGSDAAKVFDLGLLVVGIVLFGIGWFRRRLPR